jgi:hypothetical protein
MEKEYLIEFIASYFYKKGHKDAKSGFGDTLDGQEGKTLTELIKECKKAYRDEVDEQRKTNPHHHANRID